MKKKYIDDLQKFRVYYADIFNNYCFNIDLTELEKEILFYVEEELEDSNYVKRYLNRSIHKNDYISLEFEYFNNKKLNEMIKNLIKERKKIEIF